jgi:hypothetical protein
MVVRRFTSAQLRCCALTLLVVLVVRGMVSGWMSEVKKPEVMSKVVNTMLPPRLLRTSSMLGNGISGGQWCYS